MLSNDDVSDATKTTATDKSCPHERGTRCEPITGARQHGMQQHSTQSAAASGGIYPLLKGTLDPIGSKRTHVRHDRRIQWTPSEYSGRMTNDGARIAIVVMHSNPEALASDRFVGLNRRVMSTAVELAARGVEVDIVTRATEGAEYREIAPGLGIHFLAAGDGDLDELQLAHATDEFGEAFAALGRSRQYAVIHSHYWLSGIAALPAALELGIPLAHSFYSLSAATEPDRRWHSERFLAAQANALIAESAAEAAMLIDQLAAPADRVWVVPPGVDSEVFAPRESTIFDRGPDEPVVTVVSGGDGVALAISATAALAEPRPLLVVVGAAATVSSELAAVEFAHAAGADVRFMGALDHDELAKVLAASTLVLVPDASHRVSLVALEAAASGVPVIAMDAAAARESIAPGFTGLLVTGADPEEWSRTMAGLLADPAARATLGEAGRLRAHAFSWGATAASLMGVFAALDR